MTSIAPLSLVSSIFFIMQRRYYLIGQIKRLHSLIAINRILLRFYLRSVGLFRNNAVVDWRVIKIKLGALK